MGGRTKYAQGRAARRVSRRKTPGMLAARASCDPGAAPATVTGEHMVFSHEPTSLWSGAGAKHKTLVFIMKLLGPLAAACDPAAADEVI